MIGVIGLVFSLLGWFGITGGFLGEKLGIVDPPLCGGACVVTGEPEPEPVTGEPVVSGEGVTIKMRPDGT